MNEAGQSAINALLFLELLFPFDDYFSALCYRGCSTYTPFFIELPNALAFFIRWGCLGIPTYFWYLQNPISIFLEGKVEMSHKGESLLIFYFLSHTLSNIAFLVEVF